MNKTNEKVQTFFEESDLVYRRKMNIIDIAQDICESAINSIDPNLTEEYVTEVTEMSVLAATNLIDYLSTKIKRLKLQEKTYYKILGYYNCYGDIKELAGKSADEIVEYFNKGLGHFTSFANFETEELLTLEDEEANLEEDIVRVTKDGEYVVSDSSWVGWDDNLENKSPDNETEVYIDIYVKVRK